MLHRDFSLIFDTLTQFEETLLQHKIEHGGADEDEPEQANGTDHDDGEDFLLKDDENDIDLRCGCLQFACYCMQVASMAT